MISCILDHFLGIFLRGGGAKFKFAPGRQIPLLRRCFRMCKVLAHVKLISKGRSTCTCCIYITDSLYHKIHEIPLKLLLLTLCI